MGDKLLIEIGMTLKNMVRNNDKVSRVGGDEFMILLTDIKSENDVCKIYKKRASPVKKWSCS